MPEEFQMPVLPESGEESKPHRHHHHHRHHSGRSSRRRRRDFLLRALISVGIIMGALLMWRLLVTSQ